MDTGKDIRFRHPERRLEDMLMEIALLTKPPRYTPILAEYITAVKHLKLNKYYVLGRMYSLHTYGHPGENYDKI